MRAARTLAAVAIAAVALTGLATAPAAHAAAPAAGPTVPDPTTPGTLKVVTETYNLGDKAFKVPGFKGPIELAGVVHHPAKPAGKKLPLLIFLHGRHSTCYKGKGDNLYWPCKEGAKPIPSYRGYDYIGKILASRGYVVVSISANGINAGDGESSDDGMKARGMLVQKHLDLWKTWNTKGGKPFGTSFKGALDLTRVGTMGHSRGGEGVVHQYEINAAKGNPYGIKAVLPLAPTDFRRKVVTGAPMATLLPFCDGDVSDLQGVHYYDDARYRSSTAAGAKHTITVMGTNHNFFNTVWSPSSHIPGGGDDWGGRKTSVCHPTSKTRLSETAQRQAGLAYVAAYFRYYIGGEQAFAPLWRGEAGLPKSAGPAEVLVSYHGPAASRRDVNRIATEADLRTNALGGKVTRSGMRLWELCGGPVPDRESCLLRPGSLSEPHRGGEGKAGMTILMNGWQDGAGSFTDEIPATAADVSGFRALAFRAAVDFTDPRNPKGARQDLELVVTDSKGGKVSIDLAPYSAALANQPLLAEYDVVPRFLLNQVRVPLTAFKGVDLHALRTVTLRYDVVKNGTIGLTDLAFTD